ncbi:MAG: recombination protein RecF, partial [SAR86 cluster bacterium]|nr:recombination protein RecF [SAR86 cluster bacterium]
IKAFEAMKNRDRINAELEPLVSNKSSIQVKIDSLDLTINQINEENSSLPDKLEKAQKNVFALEASINTLKSNQSRLSSSKEKTKIDLENAKANYEEAKRKEESMENLSPKEKAIAVLDNIIKSLSENNINIGNIQERAKELKSLLKDILQIASAQSKSLTDELLKRQDELNALLITIEDDITNSSLKLDEHESNLNTADKELEEFKDLRNKVDNEISKIEDQKSSVVHEFRLLTDQINQFNLELRTYEINLENALSSLSRAGVNISDMNPSDFEGMDLDLLENTLDKVQENISKLGNVNFTSPEEYKNRQIELEKLIEDGVKEKTLTESAMAELVQKSSEAESVLVDIRKKQSHFNENLRELETKKQYAELDVKKLADKITDTRLELKTYEINLDNANKQIQDSGIEMGDIDLDKYKEMDINNLQDELAKIQSKIIRLGAINLAAPDEIAEESKRKEELDIQYDDLTQALEKLSSAIKTIDNETKSMFKDSFDSVNARIKEVFPKLFGGGFAELTLTDDDPLNAGVVLMARPPGKKNSSISQLSGGEKALTALSLVFSIFELNPAPFCMLDEVDAPLDDLNTMRFINMVEEMSKEVQFIFITHNKVSMEKSDYLMGVTMQEPGVSRLVSVDMKEALEFVET